MNTKFNLSTAEVIQAIRQGDQAIIRKLYQAYRAEFALWALKYYRCQEEDAADVFQETLLAFYRNVVNGKIDDLSCSLKTYVFGIGKNYLLKQYYQKQRMKPDSDITTQQPDLTDLSLSQSYERQHLDQVIMAAIDQLKPNCQEIIRLFYYREFSIEAIQHRLGYKNEVTVRNQKKRCMQYLRKYLEPHYSKGE